MEDSPFANRFRGLTDFAGFVGLLLVFNGRKFAGRLTRRQSQP